nr:hypothetical protein [Hydrogenophaga palleronii]
MEAGHPLGLLLGHPGGNVRAQVAALNAEMGISQHVPHEQDQHARHACSIEPALAGLVGKDEARQRRHHHVEGDGVSRPKCAGSVIMGRTLWNSQNEPGHP